MVSEGVGVPSVLLQPRDGPAEQEEGERHVNERDGQAGETGEAVGLAARPPHNACRPLRRRGATLTVAATAMTSTAPSATFSDNTPLPGGRLAMESAKNTASAMFGTTPSAVPAT